MTDEENQMDNEEEEKGEAPTELIGKVGESDPRTAEMPAAPKEEEKTPVEEQTTTAEAAQEQTEDDIKPKKDPKAGWVTAAMPKAQPSAPAAASGTTGSGTDVPKPSEAEPASSELEPSPAASVPAPIPAAEEGAQKGGPSSIQFMEGLGVDNPQTQRIVLGVGGLVVFLCCGCSCLAIGLGVFGGG